MKALLSTATTALAVLLVLSGCNTVEGIGEDLQSLGRKTEEAAK